MASPPLDHEGFDETRATWDASDVFWELNGSAVHGIGTRCRRNSGGGAGPLRRAVAFFREAVVLLGDACDVALLGLHAS